MSARARRWRIFLKPYKALSKAIKGVLVTIRAYTCKGAGTAGRQADGLNEKKVMS